ncbi:GntR family transcriptional regulator [Salinarimonas rosea]|uniref:GntR family transcriptional regulator n=1 Tax=Salinarimonas rosea TaxID=552063 RepID=UPI000A00E0DF|nr:GntR family transcriptional regulator [Salinarimonas rosea]
MAGKRTSAIERSDVPAPISRPVSRLVAALDRGLPIPLGVQLRGLVEYGIASGELKPGDRLPSVRECAEEAGIAPMTVSKVYDELREAGLIATKPGAGTYVAEIAPGGLERMRALRRLQSRAEALFAEAEAAGLSAADVANLVSARAARGAPRGLALLFVGVFPDATRGYAEHLARHLEPRDRVDAATIDDLRAGAVAAADYDVVVSLVHRRGEVEALVGPGLPVVGLSVIPSEETRARLAAIDPMARVGMVSVFPEFVPIMKPGVLRFAPDVADVDIRLLDDPDLDVLLRGVDVLVYASGAELALPRLPRGAVAIEFRHVPSPHAVRETLLPLVEEMRAGLARDNAT